MFMPMSPLQSWALILLIGFTIFLIVQAFATLPIGLGTDVDAAHEEDEPGEEPVPGPSVLQTRLYDWAVDGI